MSYDERARMWKLAGRYMALGIEMGFCLGLPTMGGYWLDQHYGFSPRGSVVGIVIGVGAAISSAVRAVRQARTLL